MENKYKNCPSCKFYNRGQIKMYSEDLPHSCDAGHKEVFEKWWIDNGSKTDRTTLTELECYESTEIGKMLDRALSKSIELLEKLKESNHGKDK